MLASMFKIQVEKMFNFDFSISHDGRFDFHLGSSNATRRRQGNRTSTTGTDLDQK